VLRGSLMAESYGISDSGQSLAIILFTDIFVGFHSPEGGNGAARWVFRPPRFAPAGDFVLPVFSSPPSGDPATIFQVIGIFRISPGCRLFGGTLRNMNGGVEGAYPAVPAVPPDAGTGQAAVEERAAEHLRHHQRSARFCTWPQTLYPGDLA